jgi:hypothetical protein
MRAGLLKTALSFLGAAAFLASLAANIWLTEQRDRVPAAAFWSLRIGLSVCALLAAAAVLYFTVIQGRGRIGRCRKVFVISYSLLVSFLLLEAVFMFVARSQNVGYSLAAQTWHRRYWRPTNEYGYRDRSVDLNEIRDKVKIFALGDSFTAGWGIDSIADRFSDLLQARLPPPYRVLNLGANASDTRGEFKRLLAFPVKPDILILQYFGNDIEEVVWEAKGARFVFRPYQNLPKILRPLFMGSYFLNYIYWQIPEDDVQSYTSVLLASYEDPRLLRRHYADLQQFVDFSHANRIPLIVVIFPFLRDLATSRRFTVPIEHFFSRSGAAVVSVSDLVAAIPPQQRVVNSNDSHASKLVHRIVADELYRVLAGKGWLHLPAGVHGRATQPPAGNFPPSLPDS